MPLMTGTQALHILEIPVKLRPEDVIKKLINAQCIYQELWIPRVIYRRCSSIPLPGLRTMSEVEPIEMQPTGCLENRLGSR